MQNSSVNSEIIVDRLKKAFQAEIVEKIEKILVLTFGSMMIALALIFQYEMK